MYMYSYLPWALNHKIVDYPQVDKKHFNDQVVPTVVNKSTYITEKL